MLFVSVEDFLHKAKETPPLTREEEKQLAIQKPAGDCQARERLLEGCLPFVASFIRRAPREVRTLSTVYACVTVLEQAMDRFDFSQDGETFAHYLGWRLRQCITRIVAERT